MSLHSGRHLLLVIDDDESIPGTLSLALPGGCRVLQAPTRERGVRLLSQNEISCVLLDLHLPPTKETTTEGFRALGEIRRMDPFNPIVVATADSDPSLSARALSEGACDIFLKPLEIEEFGIVMRRILDKRSLAREGTILPQDTVVEMDFGEIIGSSPEMQEVFRTTRKVADSTATVLIHGESGTGKELVARALHANSARRKKTFVAVNCSALPETLIETELFGHERGAFTGAVAQRVGRFEKADGGTLFLDEIGTLTPPVQMKLLRALEMRSFERVGGRDTIQVDIRVIAATNQDLESLIAAGLFREDLYYRLNVVPIYLPPLRHRGEDIRLLVAYFLKKFCRDYGRPLKAFDPRVEEMLLAHPWRGNVRELKHTVERLVLLTDGETIVPRDLSTVLRGGMELPHLDALRIPEQGIQFDRAVQGFEERLLREAIRRAGGIKARAGELLGVDKYRIKYLCRKHNL